MTTKKKIRRAFESATPAVMDAVLSQCPAKKETAEIVTAKSYSRRREIFATAAAFALLIVMGFGLAWFIGSGGINVNPNNATQPKPSYISLSEAINLALQDAYPGYPELDHETYAGYQLYEMKETGYLVKLWYYTKAYTYDISYTGEVGEPVVKDYEDVDPVTARDVALNKAGFTVEDVTYLDTSYMDTIYYINFVVNGTMYRYSVRNNGGYAKFSYSKEWETPDWSLEDESYLTPQEAIDIALDEYGISYDQLIWLDMSAAGNSQYPKYDILVRFWDSPLNYRLQISAITGEVLYANPDNGRSFKPIDPDNIANIILSQEKAMTIALMQVPEYIRTAYNAGTEGYGGNVEKLTTAEDWYYRVTVTSPNQNWTYLLDHRTGQILSVDTDATDCEFHAWAQGRINDKMKVNKVYTFRSYSEMQAVISGNTIKMVNESLFQNHTVLAIPLEGSSSASRLRVTEVFRKADGNYVVTIDKSNMPGVGADMITNWVVYVVLETKLPADAKVTYQIVRDTVSYQWADINLVNSLGMLPMDTATSMESPLMQWNWGEYGPEASFDTGDFVYVCRPESEDVDGDGILDIYLQDSQGNRCCLYWNPSKNWFLPADYVDDTPPTDPTVPPTEPTVNELAPFSYQVGHFTPAKDLVVGNWIIQSTEELTEYYGGKVPEGMQKYDDAFFSGNTLILIAFGADSTQDERIRDITMSQDGTCEVIVDIYHPSTVTEDWFLESYAVEINRVIIEDTDVTVQIRSHLLQGYHEQVGYKDSLIGPDGIDYTVPGEKKVAYTVGAVVSSYDHTAKDEDAFIRSTEELALLCGGTLPEELQKYDDAFFAKNTLIAEFISYKGEFSDLTVKDDGTYILYGDENMESRPFMSVCLLEISGQVPEGTNFYVDIVNSQHPFTAEGEQTGTEKQLEYSFWIGGSSRDAEKNLYVIRSVEELAAVCGGAVPEGLPKYDDAYFADNSLLLRAVSGSVKKVLFNRVMITEEGTCFVEADAYYPLIKQAVYNPCWIFVEIAQKLAPETEVVFQMREHTIEANDAEFSTLFETVDGIDQVATGEKVEFKQGAVGGLYGGPGRGNFAYRIQSVEELEALFMNGSIPENMKKYDADYFNGNALIVLFSCEEQNPNIMDLQILRDGSYLLRVEIDNVIGTKQICTALEIPPFDDNTGFILDVFKTITDQ